MRIPSIGRVRAFAFLAYVAAALVATCSIATAPGCAAFDSASSERDRYASIVSTSTTSLKLIRIGHSAGRISDESLVEANEVRVALDETLIAYREAVLTGDESVDYLVFAERLLAVLASIQQEVE